jgi:transcriptional regulator with XRE-family HTH domain
VVYCLRMTSCGRTSVAVASTRGQYANRGIPVRVALGHTLCRMGGNTSKARALGAELKAARQKTPMSIRQLAEVLNKNHATVARWEAGDRSPQVEDVASYLTAVGVNGDRYQEILDLARDTDGSHWLGVGMPEQQRQLAALLDFERDATGIIDVSPLLVCGILQTADYARAIMRAGEVPPQEIESRVAMRLGRRDALQRETPACLTALIGEAALDAAIGGPKIMADQLRYLAKVAQWPTVDLRVIPLRADWHPAMEGPFTIVEFPKAAPIVHLENRISGLYLHERRDVDSYLQAAERVLHIAMSPDDSSELIAEKINRLEST